MQIRGVQIRQPLREGWTVVAVVVVVTQRRLLSSTLMPLLGDSQRGARGGEEFDAPVDCAGRRMQAAIVVVRWRWRNDGGHGV